MSKITKLALEKSLKDLLEEKPLSKITINDITDKCGVTRMTFYYHFQDIYDLVEWICQEEAARVLEGKKSYNTWQQGYLDIFNLILSNKNFILNVYNSVSQKQILDYLYKLTYGLVMEVVEEKSEGISISIYDKEFIANFYKYALVGILVDWIKNGMKGDANLIVTKLSTMIHGDVEKAIENLRGDK